MQKISLLLLLTGGLLLASCKSGDKKPGDTGRSGDAPSTLTDSLLKDIDEGHITGMSKIGRLHNTQKEVQRVADSLAALPAGAQQKNAGYLSALQAVLKDMQYADFAMDKWMMEYDEDSASGNPDQRLLYLKSEKEKVDKMKEVILTSLQKADSLLKQRP